MRKARTLSALMLDAFEACGPDNEWAQGAIERLRAADHPEVEAVVIDAELTQAAAYTHGCYTAWLRTMIGGPL